MQIVDPWVDRFNELRGYLIQMGAPESKVTDYHWLKSKIHRYKDRLGDEYYKVVSLIEQVHEGG